MTSPAVDAPVWEREHAMLVAGLSDGDTQLVDAVATTIGGPLVSASLKGDCKTYG